MEGGVLNQRVTNHWASSRSQGQEGHGTHEKMTRIGLGYKEITNGRQHKRTRKHSLISTVNRHGRVEPSGSNIVKNPRENNREGYKAGSAEDRDKIIVLNRSPLKTRFGKQYDKGSTVHDSTSNQGLPNNEQIRIPFELGLLDVGKLEDFEGFHKIE